jgi:hypothetical protein
LVADPKRKSKLLFEDRAAIEAAIGEPKESFGDSRIAQCAAAALGSFSRSRCHYVDSINENVSIF